MSFMIALDYILYWWINWVGYDYSNIYSDYNDYDIYDIWLWYIDLQSSKSEFESESIFLNDWLTSAKSFSSYKIYPRFSLFVGQIFIQRTI